MSVIEAAKSYLESGLKALPTTKDKRPALRGEGSVLKYREYDVKPKHVEELFQTCEAVSILTGKCSGNLEVIDVDTKNDIDGNLQEKLWDAFYAHTGDLVDTLPLVETKSGGFHIYYRCDEIEGNQKLASRKPTFEEVLEDKNAGPQVLVETRGEGGYVVAPPSNGYTLLEGDLSEVPKITVDQRNGLLMAAKSIDSAPIEIARKMATSKPRIETDGLRPGDDYNDRADCEEVIRLMIVNGWSEVSRSRDGNKVFLLRPGKATSKTSGNFDLKERVLFIYSSSTIFTFHGDCGGFKPFEIYTTLVHGKGNYSASAKDLSSKGYGQPSPAPKPNKQDNKDGSILTFWDVLTDKKGNVKVIFSRIKFIEWLASNGFGRYHYTPDNWALIRHQSNIVEKVSKSDLKGFVFRYIRGLPFEFDGTYRKQLSELVARGINSFFSDDLLEVLDPIEVDTHRDTPDEAYLYYENCVVKRTKAGTKLLPYTELDGYVWRDQITKRPYREIKDNTNDYKRFVWIVCGCLSGGQLEETLQQRIKAVERAIGFALHSYKDPVNCPTIMIYDETQDSENPEGGTGKGIFLNGLGYIKKMCKIGGKLHSLDSTFAFQRVDVDTQLLVFEDVKKGWKFEKIFSITTEGITIEKKNKDAFFIPFAKSAKTFVTSNYPIAGQGSSHERRRLELEFNGYFRDTTPFEHFGHRLFDDWSKEDWLAFDNYMVYCLGQYLEHGLIKPPIINLNERKLNSRTHPQFVAFIRPWLKEGRFSYREVHQGLIGFNPDFEKYNQTTITRWTNIFMKHEDVDYKPVKINDGIHKVNGVEVKKYTQKGVTTLDKNKVGKPENEVEQVGDLEKRGPDGKLILPF